MCRALGQWIGIVLERDLGHEARVLLHRVIHCHQTAIGQPDGVSSGDLFRFGINEEKEIGRCVEKMVCKC